MNNSRIVLDKVSLNLDEPVNTDNFKERESTLVKVIEAIARIKDSEEWSTLKSLIFDGSLENLEKKLKNESEKVKLDDSEIYRTQGELRWARKYADLSRLADSYKLELANIRKIIRN